jgi:hypothetical protein
MRTRTILAALLLGLGAGAPPVGASVDVTLQPGRLNTVVGDRFSVASQVINTGAAPTGSQLAHLNVVSLTSDVYVDPEDWSAERTQWLDPLEPGESTSLSWDLQAVNVGSFDVYVVLLPADPGQGQDRLAVSQPVHLTVAGRPTLSAGGTLPVVIAVPILLGLIAVITSLRRRRR